MPNVVDIPEGRTNDFLVHGVFAIIAGGLLFLVHWSLTVVLVMLATSLFLVSSGIEVDLERKKARVYKALGILRAGNWVQMDRYNHIAIRYTNETQVMRTRYNETDVRTRTYDLHLTNANGASLLFHDFADHAKARQCAEAMAKHWSITFTDEVQERRQQAQVRAQTRRR